MPDEVFALVQNLEHPDVDRHELDWQLQLEHGIVELGGERQETAPLGRQKHARRHVDEGEHEEGVDGARERHPPHVAQDGVLQNRAQEAVVRILGADDAVQNVWMEHVAHLQHNHRDDQHVRDACDPQDHDRENRVLDGEGVPVDCAQVQKVAARGLEKHAEQDGKHPHLEEDDDDDLERAAHELEHAHDAVPAPPRAARCGAVAEALGVIKEAGQHRSDGQVPDKDRPELEAEPVQLLEELLTAFDLLAFKGALRPLGALGRSAC
mmetsp:Transcript_22309/g.71329  ORF Transcript_22309/g.71329 Transcript_22309/m.71329 type:complete len:266 (+) Transcript_22309:1696-2493(+)